MRVVSRGKYLLAGVLTFLIFALGITLGFILEDYRYGLVEDINTEQDVNYLSLQLQYLYLTSFSSYDNCPILSTALKSTVVDLSESLEDVVNFEEESSSSARQELVLRRYALDNLRYWLLAAQSREKCDLDIVPILYFYSSECPSCPNQGTILTHFKDVFGEKVLIFPINLDLREVEPMVEIIMLQFSVQKFPTIIVDGRKYEGVVKQEQLKTLICRSLDNAPECS